MRRAFCIGCIANTGNPGLCRASLSFIHPVQQVFVAPLIGGVVGIENVGFAAFHDGPIQVALASEGVAEVVVRRGIIGV